MEQTFTRRELYELVWSTPIVTLAARFQLSDRGLAKTCARHQIPVPGRGYWAKIEAGLSATKTPLWKIDNPALETVHLGGHRPAVSPSVAFAIERANDDVEASRRERKLSRPTEEPPEKSTSMRQPKQLVAFEPVIRPDAAISGLVSKLKSEAPDNKGELSIAGIRIHHSSKTRLVSILHHLAIALQERGITFSHNDKGVLAAIGPDDIRLEITEERKREKHVPSPAELKKKADFEKRREIAQRRGQWLFPESFWPEYDYFHSGKLSFDIQNWAQGARKRWSDGKQQNLEGMLEGLADGVLFHLSFEKARREEREADERRRKHLAHRRELHKQRQAREEKRLLFLRQLADDRREADDLRTTIDHASKLMAQDSPEYRRMITWAEQRLSKLEVQNQLDTLTSNLRDQDLFPEPDELYDPEGDPPPPRYAWGD